MSSAYPFCESRTPSMLRKTSVSLSDATAAFAMTKATVALSELSLADERLTQNFPAIVLVLLSLDPVLRMIRKNQMMPRQTAPRREVLRNPGVGCRQLENSAGPHGQKSHAKPHHQLAASHVSGIPLGTRSRLGSGG